MTLFKHIKHMALVPLAFGLTQCDLVEAIHNPTPKDGPYAYDLVLTMSPKANVALKSSEGLTVDAYYYGHAKPGFATEADSLHRIVLGQETWSYAASLRRLHLYAAEINTKKLSKTIEGEPIVLVTVLGSGLPGKVVDCGSYIGPIRVAHERSPEMHCELESEQYWEGIAASAAEGNAKLGQR